MRELEVKRLSNQVRQISYDIHVYLGPGHLEKVYEAALLHRLRKANVRVNPQHPLTVYDEDGTLPGEYYADLLVEDILIVEIKAGRSLALEHEAQILGYLRAAKLERNSNMDY